MQIGIANGIPLNATVTGDDLIPAYDQASGTEGYVNLNNAVQNAFKGNGAGTANGVLYLDGSKAATSGSSLVFDGINLGLGVTPSAWGAYRALQVNNASMSSAAATSIVLSANTYNANGSGWKYTSTAAATQYEQFNGGHYWLTAPSGTADNAISFTSAMTLDASGNLLVGCTSVVSGQKGIHLSPDAGNRYLLSSSTSLSYQLQFVNANGAVGAITTTGTATAYNTSSDYRLKDNQAPLTDSGAFIDALKPKTWNWKADGSKGVGFIAHEVQEVSPTSVVGEKDAMRVEQYEVSPAVPATYDEEGNELTPAVEAVMGEREVPAYQAMEYGSAEFIANIVAELQSLRKRVAALEAK